LVLGGGGGARAVPRVGASAPTAGTVGLTCEPLVRPCVSLRACGAARVPHPTRRWLLGFPSGSPCARAPFCSLALPAALPLGLAGVLSGVAVGSSMVRRTGSIFPLAALGALLGGVTGNLFADHVCCGGVTGRASWGGEVTTGGGACTRPPHGRGAPSAARTCRVSAFSRGTVWRNGPQLTVPPCHAVACLAFPRASGRSCLASLPPTPPYDRQVASWVLGTYKHDPVATREALTAFAVQRHPPGSPPPPST